MDQNVVDPSNFRFSFFKETVFTKLAEVHDHVTNYMVVRADLPVGNSTYAILVNLPKDGQDNWYPSPWLHQGLLEAVRNLPDLPAEVHESTPTQVGT